MKLNRFETLLMNNPVRSLSLRRIEVPMLARFLPLDSCGQILEIGCGRGEAAEVISRRFRGAKVTAFDLDPAQIGRARRRLGTRPPEGCPSLAVADAEHLPFSDGSFDAVFELGILHHVPGWAAAIGEVFRVLRPGGGFAFEDLSSRFSESRLARVFTEHPEGLDMTAQSFESSLAAAGFDVVRFWRFGSIAMAGAARRP